MSPHTIRRVLAVTHLWLGLIGGLVFSLLAVSGAIVTFRPQIATLLSPPAIDRATCVPLDWNQAQRDIEAAALAPINRIYAPSGNDPRYHLRMRTDVDAIYTHVIYDACAGAVLGTVPMAWMDWLVDFHHNFLAGRTGRQFVGLAGLGLFLSGLGGLLLILLSRPTVRRLLQIQLSGNTRRAMFDLHRTVGTASVVLLLLQAFTGLWLCFPQPLRAVLALVAPLEAETRAARAEPSSGPAAGLGDLFAAAQRAIPDGVIREVRMPDGTGNVQVRMWRRGDFRSLGNNVASLDRVTTSVRGLDLYDTKPGGSRIVQAMSGLHYAEWGGLPYRTLYGLSGAASLPLSLSGSVYWWLRTRRRSGVVSAAVGAADATAAEAV